MDPFTSMTDLCLEYLKNWDTIRFSIIWHFENKILFWKKQLCLQNRGAIQYLQVTSQDYKTASDYTGDLIENFWGCSLPSGYKFNIVLSLDFVRECPGKDAPYEIIGLLQSSLNIWIVRCWINGDNRWVISASINWNRKDKC